MAMMAMCPLGISSNGATVGRVAGRRTATSGPTGRVAGAVAGIVVGVWARATAATAVNSRLVTAIRRLVVTGPPHR